MTEDRSAAAAGGGHAHHLVVCDYSAMELTGEHEGALADLQRLQERCRGDPEAGLAVIAPDLRHGACRHLSAAAQGSGMFELRGRWLITHGLLGFIAGGGTCLEIRSQFGGGRSGGDYLLCCMPERTGGLSLPDDPVPGVDFTPSERPAALMTLSFAHQLRCAMRRGLPRRYRLRRCNDLRLRGRLDVGRQLQLNLPFTGRCACTAREYDTDHEGTQLVAQALERLWRQSAAAGLLEQLCTDPELRSAVCRLRRATSSAPRRRPAEPWRCALRGVSGPLHHPWHELQVMAAMILRGQSADPAAPGRWRWEACLEQVLAGLGFTHAGRSAGRAALRSMPQPPPGGTALQAPWSSPTSIISDRVVVDA